MLFLRLALYCLRGLETKRQHSTDSNAHDPEAFKDWFRRYRQSTSEVPAQITPTHPLLSMPGLEAPGAFIGEYYCRFITYYSAEALNIHSFLSYISADRCPGSRRLSTHAQLSKHALQGNKAVDIPCVRGHGGVRYAPEGRNMVMERRQAGIQARLKRPQTRQ